jgi:hypothetical protein
VPVFGWEQVRKRYEAFWAHAVHDRPLIALNAPRSSAPAGPAPVLTSSPSADLERQWTDPDAMVDATLESLAHTFRAGESLPVLYHNWAAGHALPFGCLPHFAEHTVWVDPAPDGPDGFPSLAGWERSPWWEWMRRCTRVASARSQGRYFVLPVWGNHAGDTLALVRGSQRLMLDLAENRSWVASAVRRMSEILITQAGALWELVSPALTGLEGSINYVSLWSPGRTMGFDCDVSCMIGARDFRDIFLPPLVDTMRTVDHRIYHLDGPGALHHLETLLDVPEIDAIQWVPGDGQPGALSWVPMIREIQRRGKSVVVYARPGEVQPLLAELSPEGLFVGTWCASEREGRELAALLRIEGGN